MKNCFVDALTVDSIDVQLNELPEGCSSGGGGGVLPISTPELRATRLDAGLVSLRWKTFDNDFTNRWILQRRLNLADDFATVWELTTNVFLSGDRNDLNDYPGTSYYRLYGVSPEGEKVYSTIVSVGNSRRMGKLLVYPNPFTSTARISLPSISSTAKLTLVDGLGRIVWRTLHPAGGSPELELPSIPPGAFLLRWENPEGQTISTRFVKTGR